MSAAVAPASPSGARLAGRGDIRVTQTRVIRSEWIKFRSLRSSWFTLGFAVAALVGIAALVGSLTNSRWSSLSVGDRLRFNPVNASLAGVGLAELAVGVLGVLIISGEYGTGMIRASLSAVPRRLPVLWAKAIVFGLVTLVSMEIASFAAFFVGQATLGVHGTTIGAPNALRAVAGAGLFLTAVALLGLAFGFMLRSTAAGIASLFGLLLVIPGIVFALPSSWQNAIRPYLPNEAGGALFTLPLPAHSLAPWTGFAVMLAWVAAGIVVSTVVLRRRDA